MKNTKRNEESIDREEGTNGWQNLGCNDYGRRHMADVSTQAMLLLNGTYTKHNARRGSSNVKQRSITRQLLQISSRAETHSQIKTERRREHLWNFVWLYDEHAWSHRRRSWRRWRCPMLKNLTVWHLLGGFSEWWGGSTDTTTDLIKPFLRKVGKVFPSWDHSAGKYRCFPGQFPSQHKCRPYPTTQLYM